VGPSSVRQHSHCRCGTRLAADNPGGQCAPCERASRDKLIAPPDVPSEFWQTEQLRDGFTQQHMGRVARAYRLNPHHQPVHGPNGISQRLLGQWLGLSQAQVSRIENGPPIRNLDTLAYWARTLHIPAGLLWFRLPGDTRLVTAEPAGSNLAPATARSARELPTLRWESEPDEAYQSAITLWEYTLEDNRLACTTDTTSLSALTLRWLVAPNDTAVHRRTGWLRVGLGDVTRLRSVRRRLKALDDAHGGGIAFPMAVAYLRREVAPLLQGSYDDFTGRELFLATAELKLDVGWMAYDAGNSSLAWRYMVQALRLSHAVDNRLFGARVLAAMSHQALYLNHASLAVDLARAGREGAKHIAPPKVQAMLAAMEACAQAACQQAEQCATALGEAEKSLADAAPDDLDWLDFDEGGLSGHAARAWRDLRQFRKAEHQAVASLELCKTEHCRTRAERNAILATTQLQLGDVEAAAATGLLIVADAWSLQSSRVYRELAALVSDIEASGSTGARDFVSQGRKLLAVRNS